MAYKLFVNGNVLPASDLNDAFGTSGWTAFTPTLASGSLTVGTGGTLSGYYMQIGKTVFYRIRATFGSSGRALNNPVFVCPVTQSAQYTDYSVMGTMSCFIGGSSYLGIAQQISSGIRPIVQQNSAGTAVFSTTVPGTLASGNTISFAGFYEAA